MRTALLIFITVVTGLAETESRGQTAGSITVCLSRGAEIPPTYPAQRRAATIFAGIGIRVEWHAGMSCPAAPEAIRISITGRPAKDPDNVLAYALPYEGRHIVIFYERIALRSSRPQELLAHVLVHEVAHILQGISRHSYKGIMKARWSDEDIYRMRFQPLAFAAEDVYLIHRGLEVRAERAGAAIEVVPAARANSFGKRRTVN